MRPLTKSSFADALVVENAMQAAAEIILLRISIPPVRYTLIVGVLIKKVKVSLWQWKNSKKPKAS
jgi:hypothetical protein